MHTLHMSENCENDWKTRANVPSCRPPAALSKSIWENCGCLPDGQRAHIQNIEIAGNT